MFGKDTNSAFTPPQAPQTPTSRQSSVPASPSGNYVSKDVSISGKLTLSGDITIDGKLDGEISSQGVVTLSENAVIKADIHAVSIIISGRVEGNISATDRLEVLSTANITGDLKAGILKVDPGATFVGSCEVGPSAKASAPKAAPAKQAAPAETKGA